MRKGGSRIEIPGDWAHRDRHLNRLAEETGFRTVALLLRHIAYEVSRARTPAELYRGLALFHQEPGPFTGDLPADSLQTPPPAPEKPAK